MSEDIRGLRRALAAMTRGRGLRYPAEIRRRIGVAAIARRDGGASWQVIGGELGIPHETVRRLAAAINDDHGEDSSAWRCGADRVDAAGLGAHDDERPPRRRSRCRRRRRASAVARVITLPRTVRVWAYGRPTDLRKGYNGLVGLVKEELRRDVMDGELFLFVNIRRTSCKVVLWDETRLCIFMKRLERGRFADLWSGARARRCDSLPASWPSSSRAA